MYLTLDQAHYMRVMRNKDELQSNPVSKLVTDLWRYVIIELLDPLYINLLLKSVL